VRAFEGQTVNDGQGRRWTFNFSKRDRAMQLDDGAG
jgi:hypothetical protein